MTKTVNRLLVPGEPAPWFKAPVLDGNPKYAFDTVAGRWVVLLFLGTADGPKAAAAFEHIARYRDMFDDMRAWFFGVSVNHADAAEHRIAQALPGIRWFLDYDLNISRRYGAIAEGERADQYRPHWLLLDRALRVTMRTTIDAGHKMLAWLRDQIDAPPHNSNAPVLSVPNVLTAEQCRQLVDLYTREGGSDSGFMREVDGKTVRLSDHWHKRRSDCTISDPQTIVLLKARINAILRPMIHRAYQFDVTRIERFIVACYDGDSGGHFRPHRDNTTKGTAHRRFACTINLNDDYDGGDLRFPEFGTQTYRAPVGGAVIFSCSLLHEALPVTRGQRFAFLPFLYDDAAAIVREKNLQFVSEELANYRSGLPTS